ncbi:hypothetical protein CHU98_g2400 [Xylaria longipes]|nr:hypothetical protein CHU98_g2400 [Xylaria longipes]
MEPAASPFALEPTTIVTVPEPRIRTSGDQALMSCAERPRRHHPKQTPVRRTRMAATVVPDPVTSGQNFGHAVLRRAYVVAAVPGSL